MGHKLKVVRVGNSLRIAIPSSIASALGIQEGDIVELEIVGSKIRIEIGK